MLDFQIYTNNFLMLFGAFLTFFSFVYGVNHALKLVKDRI